MKLSNKFKVLIIIAVLADFTIFGYLIYSNIQLKKQVDNLEISIATVDGRVNQQGNQVYETANKLAIMEDEEKKKKEQEEYENDPTNIAVQNLDKNYFVVDLDNYKPENNEIKITEEQAKKVAQKGFEESKARISGEGADDVKSETVQIREEYANNYFTRMTRQGYKQYIKRTCYIVQRENDIGNGITIYVDATTGLIIGGGAFGD